MNIRARSRSKNILSFALCCLWILEAILPSWESHTSLLALDRFACHTEATLLSYILTTFIISWTDLRTRFHLIWVISESLNRGSEELKPFWLVLWQKRWILCRFEICSWSWSWFAVTITLNNVLNSTICWNTLSVMILTISSMGTSSRHHSLLSLFLFLYCFTIFLIRWATVSSRSRCKDTWSVMFVQWHTTLRWINVVARSRIITFLLSLYCNYFLRFFSRNHPLGLSLHILTMVDFVVSRANFVFMGTCMSFLSVFLSNEFSFFILFISKDVVVWRNRWWIREHCSLRLVVPLACCSSRLDPFWLLIVLSRSWNILSTGWC